MYVIRSGGYRRLRRQKLGGRAYDDQEFSVRLGAARGSAPVARVEYKSYKVAVLVADEDDLIRTSIGRPGLHGLLWRTLAFTLAFQPASVWVGLFDHLRGLDE